ncbi:MAG: PAS domain S-box protein [Deltaproteobacteria bacterium]|nr:PAS domain S-box protein [Deltaproteobacteria bacterium]
MARTKRNLITLQSRGKGNAPEIIPGKNGETFLKAVIAGGGDVCASLLRILNNGDLSRPGIICLGIWDPSPEAPGIRLAKAMGIPTVTSLDELFALSNEIDLIIDLSGSSPLTEEIHRKSRPGVSIIEGSAVTLLFDLAETEREKVQLERERKDHQAKIKKDTQLILDSLPYRIMVVNLDLTVDTVNETFLREFGYRREEVIGEKCYWVRYGRKVPCQEVGDICFLKQSMEEIKEKGFLSTYKERVDPNGDVRYDVITISLIRDENNEVVQILEASRDVTDRIKLEKEAIKSNTFFQNVIQSTVDGIVVLDRKGKVLIFNEGMERLTGYSAKEIVNKGHVSSFYDIDVARENMKKMRSNKHGPPGKLNPTSMTIRNRNGEEIPVTLSASIITIDNEEIGSVGVFTDMREFLKMQKDLEEAHLQLVQSERIASVGRMAAGVAHEINNPLSGIMLYAELLKKTLKENEQGLRDVEEIIAQTQRCKKIVSELLEFSRQSVGKVSSFSIDDLIDKSLGILLNQALFHNIEVIKDIEKDIPAMVGDIGQLQQVFTNLFINAADAMNGKGRLEIKARYLRNKDQVGINVSDTGPGIPKELRDKVFDIFFTTKQVGKGTGLGLSLSQNIVKLHGGSISFECPPEGGTVFTVVLPLHFIEQPKQEPLFLGLDEK